MKSNKLASVWENQVSRGWRHMDYTPGVIANCEFLYECLGKIDKGDIKEILDWGPGGGWLSKVLTQTFSDCEVHLVDIVQSNLEESSKNVFPTAHSVKTHCVKDEESVRSLGSLSPDILLAFSVIYHFPSINYWKEVSDTWKEMKPRYIIGRTFLTDGPSWERPSEEYSINTNYLRGIILNKNEFLETFTGYEVVYERRIDKNYNTHGSPSDQYSYLFVFKRK